MIIRRRHTANFTTIGNVLFEDDRLAADELGILAYLLSRPHDWEVRRPALMRRFKIGRDAIKRVIKNWMVTGWCRAEKTRLSDGTFIIVYEIRDEPGPELTEEEIRRALSPESGEAASQASQEEGPEPCVEIIPEVEPCAQPPTSQPGVADPALADPYVVDKKDLLRKDSTKKPEREDAGAHDRKARFIAAFEMRWPTAATDDRAHTARAARELPDDQEDAALNGIGPFLEKLKHAGRKTIPAGWRYLEQKPWTLIGQKLETVPHTTTFDAGSAEARAIAVLFAIAAKSSFFYGVIRSSDGVVRYSKPITPQLLALAQAPQEREWVELDHRQAGAWEDLLTAFVTVAARSRLQLGSRAPWPWPPRKDGTFSTTGPPETLMTEQDLRDFA